MSLLGFDAVGRLALGQFPSLGRTNTVLLAPVAGFALTAPAAMFRVNSASPGNSLLVGAGTARLTGSVSATSASFIFGSNGAVLRCILAAANTNYVISGLPVASGTRFAASGATCLFGVSLGTLTTTLTPAPGLYFYIGSDSSFTRTLDAWINRRFDNELWTNAESNTDGWSSTAAVSASWAAVGKPLNEWTIAASRTDTWSPELPAD